MQTKAMSYSLAWFKLEFMEVPRKFDSICKHFSFVKPWLIDDKI
jgi:hypothetical protein